ncbi:solute carrier family 35 member F5 [Choristoneura fumiferana]|uniref:solute carrier family 35 member F5 n=1 Tax=Choristoneura fumiferana TaxID=7141 RepID=UPI003D154AFE
MLILCHNYFRVTHNKNDNDDIQHFSKKKFIFGLFILLLVDVLWVVSSELTKYIYIEQKIDRPFLVTYVRSSLLFVYLVVLCFSPPTRDPCRPADYTQLLEPTAETDEDTFFTESNNSLVSIGDSTFVPVRAGETTDSDDAAPRAVRFNKVAEVRVMSAAQAGEALLARLSWAASVRASEVAQRRAAAHATRRHLRMALLFALPWFISNYLYRLSLRGTRTGSATLLASAAGALALSLGAAGRQPADRLTLPKLCGVLLTAAALVVVGVSEGRGGDWAGALAALGAALAYAVHLLLFRREMRKGDGINSPLLVGLVGCACGCIGWALGAVLAGTGVERAALPPPPAWSWLLLDAALGPLLLETLWLWGRSLTSSYVATLALGATLPLAVGWELAAAGGAWRAAAGLLAALGWALAAADAAPALAWLTAKLRTDGFSVIRNIPDLDEQSEALMSSDEPT